MPLWTPARIVAVLWCLAPLLAFGFWGDRLARLGQKLASPLRLSLPAVFGIPYLLAGTASSRPYGMVIYLGLPILIAVLLARAQLSDPQQLGNWRDFAILLLLGLPVDLRWFEAAWPPHLGVISKLILLDAGLYGFLVIRQLTQVGFNLRMGREDVLVGLRELLFYAPIAIPLGFALGFLRLHRHLPTPGSAAGALLVTFFFIAIPEEIYFRGWIQNLLERRLGRNVSLWLTAIVFGLSHFNKRSAHFNGPYVVLASIAGIFYGRAWRSRRRIAAAAITHSGVDTIWSLWLS
ncbi:MAG TPA: CPBP family intramembrane glutamic endopeptidase [Terriglobales bacterium]|nr:CPBP family intramembrane glutamic endopeptidase [Terriglobales bacterium]